MDTDKYIKEKAKKSFRYNRVAITLLITSMICIVLFNHLGYIGYVFSFLPLIIGIFIQLKYSVCPSCKKSIADIAGIMYHCPHCGIRLRD
jgi:hypothetical protein